MSRRGGFFFSAILRGDGERGDFPQAGAEFGDGGADSFKKAGEDAFADRF